MYPAAHPRARERHGRFQLQSEFLSFDFFFTAEIQFRFARSRRLDFLWPGRLDLEHFNRNAHRDHFLRGIGVEYPRLTDADPLVIANEFDAHR